MEGTNSQRAAPGYDAVAQCAVIMPFPQPSLHSCNHHSIPATITPFPQPTTSFPQPSLHSHNHHVIPAIHHVIPAIHHVIPATITPFPQSITSFPQPSLHSRNPSRHSREGGNLSTHGRRASIGPQHALADERARRMS